MNAETAILERLSNARSELASVDKVLLELFKQEVLDSQWRPIDTAPKGANGICWMLLAWGPEDDKSIGKGMRIDEKFYASGAFFCIGDKNKPYEFRELEVTPSHWMPTPACPT